MSVVRLYPWAVFIIAEHLKIAIECCILFINYTYLQNRTQPTNPITSKRTVCIALVGQTRYGDPAIIWLPCATQLGEQKPHRSDRRLFVPGPPPSWNRPAAGVEVEVRPPLLPSGRPNHGPRQETGLGAATKSDMEALHTYGVSKTWTEGKNNSQLGHLSRSDGVYLLCCHSTRGVLAMTVPPSYHSESWSRC